MSKHQTFPTLPSLRKINTHYTLPDSSVDVTLFRSQRIIQRGSTSQPEFVLFISSSSLHPYLHVGWYEVLAMRKKENSQSLNVHSSLERGSAVRIGVHTGKSRRRPRGSAHHLPREFRGVIIWIDSGTRFVGVVRQAIDRCGSVH